MICRRLLGSFTILAAVFSVPATAAAPGSEAGTSPGSQSGTSITCQPRVVDGDTLACARPGGGWDYVRFRTIDAPELRQTCLHSEGTSYDCGRVAASVLDNLIAASPVTCRITGRDRWGRSLGACGTRAVPDLERAMVWLGWAISEYGNAYLGEEATAWANDHGMWEGLFQVPKDWRAEQRAKRRRVE